MPTPQRIRDEAVAAEQQMAQLRDQASGVTTPSSLPSDDGSNVPPRDPDTQFGVAQEVTTYEAPQDPPASDGSGPIDAEAMARLQQQFATLQGNFSRQAAELQSSRERNQLLERTLERALARNEERPPVPAAPAPSPAPSSVTAKEIEEYGEDLTDFIRRLVRDGVQSAVNPLLDTIQKLTHRLSETSQVVQTTKQLTEDQLRDNYNRRMDQLVKDGKGEPDWQHINLMHQTHGDSRFVDWLNKIGEDSDQPRLSIIQRAYANYDADLCARMINKFKRDVGMPDGTRPSEDPTQTPTARVAAALVSPSTTGSGTGAPTRGRPAAKTYTEDDVKRHYDEKTKGKWRGREAEWQRIADDMDKAVLEQRYVAEPQNRRGR
jgi:hypothetical protein